jgi:hypothetical protein
MQDIASFSDLLSQLSPFSRPGTNGASGQSTPGPLPVDTSAVEADKPAPIQPTVPGSSFDSAPASPSDLAGVYKPPAAAMRQRTEMAFNFQFSVSMRQETRVLSQRPMADARPTGNERTSADERGRFSMVAREQTSLSYQSLQALYRNTASGTFREVRGFQASMFRSQTRQISARMAPEAGERYDRTARTVSRTFELNIKLEASFLGQFVGQSDQISGMDGNLLEQYLDGTDRSALESGDALQAFFDQVDGMLADSQAFVEQTLSSFFQDAASSLGLTEQEAGALQDLVTSEVTALFDDMDRFLDDARLAMAGPAARPEMELPEPVEALPEADAVHIAAESDPEVVA